MFSGRRHILAGLQCVEQFQINMQLSFTDVYRAQDRNNDNNELAKHVPKKTWGGGMRN